MAKKNYGRECAEMLPNASNNRKNTDISWIITTTIDYQKEGMRKISNFEICSDACAKFTLGAQIIDNVSGIQALHQKSSTFSQIQKNENIRRILFYFIIIKLLILVGGTSILPIF